MSLNVLIVEDEAITALDIKKKLEHWGYNVPHIAHTGSEAVELTKKLVPDLILMDIILKGNMDGIETAGEIKKQFDIPLIYLTAHSEDQIMERAKYTEPYGYLIKPLDEKELRFALDSAIYKHQTDKKLKKVNRALRMISDCNQAIVRIKNKDTLLNEICKIVVEEGGYKLAWVGMAQQDEFKSIKSVAEFGFDDGYIDSLKISWDDNKYGQSPTGKAIRNSKTFISRNIPEDPDFIPWRERAVKRGYKSSAALPLFIEKKIIGSLNIYSSEIDAFDSAELELLEELSGDISFFLESYKNRKERHKFFEELKESERRYRNIFENSDEGIFQSTPEGRYLTVNPAFAHMVGFESPEEMIKTVKDISKLYANPRQREEFKKFLETDGVVKDYEIEILRPDQGKMWMSVYSKAIKDDESSVLYYEGTAVDITEKKRILDALKESEEKYRTMVQTANEGIWAMDKNFITTFVNQRMADKLGYKKEEMISQPVSSFMFEKDLKNHYTHMKNRKKGLSENYERRFRKKDGGELWTLVAATALTDDDGQFKGSFAMFTDITELKSALEKIKITETRYRELFESLKSGVAVYKAVDNGNNFVFKEFNAAAELIDKTNRTEAIGKKVTDVFPGVKDFGLLNTFKRVWKTGKPEKHPVSIYKDERVEGWRDNYVYKLPSGEIVAVYDDVTEQKKAEENLIKSEKKYHELFDLSPQYNILLNLEGKLLDVNKAAQEFIGLSREELVGQHFTNLTIFPPEEMSLHKNNISDVLKGNPAPPTESRIIDKKGDIHWIETLLKALVEDNKIFAILIISHDITDRKTAEDHIKKALEEKKILLSEIHHRVKNNMQIISSLLNLQNSYLNDEKDLELFIESQNRVKSMALIHEKLYRSKDLVKIDFAEYVRDLAYYLFYSYIDDPERVKLDFNIEKVNLNIETAIPCGIIINELVTNSLKHAFNPVMPGKITLELHKEPEKFIMTIKDNGKGFPENIDFRHTETLGMRLVMSLVHQIDGNIELDKTKGTQFKITFKELFYETRL